MANEIDLYDDLDFVERVLANKSLDDYSRKEWEREKQNVIAEIKRAYPDLVF